MQPGSGMLALLVKSTWPIQQPLRQFRGELRLLGCGWEPERLTVTPAGGLSELWGNSWNETVLYLSESTASDNPVSEDAFMDSLFLKVSFFFSFFFF